jgi:Flp pilus assembly protein TadD
MEAGLNARAVGEFASAEQLLRRALDAAPDDYRAYQFLGALLIDRDDKVEGLEILERGADIAGPLTRDTMGIYNNLANALRCNERYDEGEKLLRELVRIGPNEWQHWHNLAQLLSNTKRPDETVAAIRRAIALEPGYGPNHAVLGVALIETGRLLSAQNALQRCLDLGWDADPTVWTHLASTYRMQGDAQRALELLQHVLDTTGPAPSPLNNLGIVLNLLGRFDEAHEHFRHGIELDPDDSTWRANYGYSLLTAGVVTEGWELWEYGLDNGPRGCERPLLKGRRWVPTDTDGRVLCYREQGVGDEILFASCLPDLERAAHDVVYEADTRLIPLFTRSFPGIEVRAQTFNPTIGPLQHDFDTAIPVRSLPRHFRPTADHFPKDRQSFLVADPEATEHWRARLTELAGGNAIVGISWRSRIKSAERRLEYTHLYEWGELFAIPGVTWVNLQYDDCDRELVAAEREFGISIANWRDVDYMNDFDTVAAIMSVCDLVVAPRNAVAMLSGALGVPTVMMGNRWDWSDLGTDTSPWFPAVDLVYRHVGEDWDQVLATAAAKVRAVASRKETS